MRLHKFIDQEMIIYDVAAFILVRQEAILKGI
jgi:hypothetical protein